MDELSCYKYYDYERAMMPENKAPPSKYQCADIINEINPIHLVCQESLEALNALRSASRMGALGKAELSALTQDSRFYESIGRNAADTFRKRLPVILSAYSFAHIVPVSTKTKCYENQYILNDRKEIDYAVEYCRRSFIYRQYIENRIWMDTVITEMSDTETKISLILWRARERHPVETAQSAALIAAVNLARKNESEPGVTVKVRASKFYEEYAVKNTKETDSMAKKKLTMGNRHVTENGFVIGPSEKGIMCIRQGYSENSGRHLIWLGTQRNDCSKFITLSFILDAGTALFEVYDGVGDRRAFMLLNVDEML